MPVFNMTLLSLLALRVVKVLGEGTPPKSPGFHVSKTTLDAVAMYAEINRATFRDLNDPAVFTIIEEGLEIYLLDHCGLTREELRREARTDVRNEVLGQHVDWVLRGIDGKRKWRSVYHGSWEASYGDVFHMYFGLALLSLVSAAGISDVDADLAQQEEHVINNTAVLLWHAIQASETVKSRLIDSEGAEAAVEGVIK